MEEGASGIPPGRRSGRSRCGREHPGSAQVSERLPTRLRLGAGRAHAIPRIPFGGPLRAGSGRTPPMDRGSRLWLPAAGLLAACGLQAVPEWPAVLADVRARHPSVEQISVDELRAGLGDPGPLLLDARSEREFATSHLCGARHAPDEAAALAVLAGERKERRIVVYCSVGLRSSALAERLEALGFTGVANLEGGIFAWANAGHPTCRGEERAHGVDPFDDRWGKLLDPSRHAR